jgi:hypothetical protein
MTTDPIFTAIESHRQAVAAYVAAINTEGADGLRDVG